MDNRDHMADQASVQRMKAIMAPARYDGIGDALKAAYDPQAAVMPDEMKALLERLN